MNKEKLDNSSLIKTNLSQVLEDGYLLTDAFLKLSGDKFIKVFHQGEIFLLSEIEKYQNKFDQFLYVNKKEQLRILKYFLNKEKIELKEKGPQDILILQNTLHNWGQNISNRMELNKELAQTAELACNASLKMLKDVPDLSKNLKFFFEKKSYLSEHSLALAIVSCSLAIVMGQKSKATLSKLALASFFHDITLNNDAQALVDDLDKIEIEDRKFIESLNLKTIPENDLAEIKEHPINAAKLIKSLEKDLLGLEEIIKYHHETPLGNGFPYELDHHRIPPLCCLFIVAHDFIKQIYQRNALTLGDRKEIIIKMEKSYAIGAFAPPSQHLGLIFRPRSKRN